MLNTALPEDLMVSPEPAIPSNVIVFVALAPVTLSKGSVTV
jgi:hypothetical protein